MKNQILRILATMLLSVAIVGCVYDYEPEDEDVQGLVNPLVVIDGDIIAGGITRVKVGLTQSLVSDEEAVPLGVAVWVESEDGESLSGMMLEETLNEFEVDTRNLDMDGKYRLCVTVPGRGEYVSQFKGVLVSPPIDSITYSVSADRSYARIEITTHNDEPKCKLYCKWNYSENWESNAVYPAELEYDIKTQVMRKLDWTEILANQYCFSESVSTGTYIANTEKLSENVIYKSVINEIPKTDTRLMRLYSILVRQTVLDKEAYIYWESIKNNTTSTGGLFGPQPSEVRGNIENKTVPGEVVIGYINVTTMAEKREFVDWLSEKIFSTNCATTLVENKKPGDESIGNTLWNSYYNMGYRPIRYPELENGGYDVSQAYWALEKCTDCRVFSNSSRPDFWPR